MNNPIQMLKNFINNSMSPKDLAMQMVSNTNNPIFINLVQMAKDGNYQGVEKFAKNVFKEQGRDFDKEMKELQDLLKQPK